MSHFSGPVVSFRSRLFGWDKDEVRVCLRNLFADNEDARKQIERLSTNLEAAHASSAQPMRQEPTGVQVERVLASAHRTAEAMKVEAENAVQQILHDAQEEAARLRSNAQADAEAITRAAASRVETLESEIQDLIDRRRVVQAMLDRAADRLNEIAEEMRQHVVPMGALIEDRSTERTSAIV